MIEGFYQDGLLQHLGVLVVSTFMVLDDQELNDFQDVRQEQFYEEMDWLTKAAFRNTYPQLKNT